MQLASQTHAPDGLLTKLTLLSEKPHHGVLTSHAAPLQGTEAGNSTALIGLRFRCSGIMSATVVAPSSSISSKLACAAKYGQAHSIGAAFGGGTIANFLGGNAVSSLLNIGLAATGNGPSPSPQSVLMSGPFLGVPVNDALTLAGQQTIDGGGSLGGTVRSTIASGIFNAATESGGISSVAAEGGELAVQGGLTAGEFASGIGLAKFGFDALTVGYGYFFGCSQ